MRFSFDDFVVRRLKPSVPVTPAQIARDFQIQIARDCIA
jgi:hypothetical protein